MNEVYELVCDDTTRDDASRVTTGRYMWWFGGFYMCELERVVLMCSDDDV